MDKNTKYIIALVALVLIVGAFYGWFKFLRPTEEIKLLDQNTCETVMKNLQDGVYKGPPLYSLSACCIDTNGNIVSCRDDTQEQLSMTVGGGTIPYDAVVVFADLKNTGLPLDATITDVRVTSATPGMADAIDNSFVQGAAIDFTGYVVEDDGTTTPVTISQSQIYPGQTMAEVLENEQVIWATVIYLDESQPNGLIPVGTAHIEVDMEGAEVTGKIAPETKTTSADLTLGEAALSFAVNIKYGYA